MTAEPVQVRAILVAEDHPLLADAMATLVGSRFAGAHVRTVHDFGSAIAAARALTPDLVLVDADMPGATPRTGVSALLATTPTARLIVISGLRDKALVEAFAAAGVAGFIPKTRPPADILTAIEKIVAGGRSFPEAFEPAAPPRPVSGRLADVAQLLGDGLTNKQIARALGIGPETVKTYVAQLLEQLGAANRTEAAVMVKSRLSAGGTQG